MAIAKMQTSQDAITKSDKQYLRSLGIKPNEITIFDLFEQLKSMPYPDTTSREAVEQHYAVIKRIPRYFQRNDATGGSTPSSRGSVRTTPLA